MWVSQCVFLRGGDDDGLCDEAGNPSKQLCDVHLFELSEQMETPRISSHKHTHTHDSPAVLHTLLQTKRCTEEEDAYVTHRGDKNNEWISSLFGSIFVSLLVYRCENDSHQFFLVSIEVLRVIWAPARKHIGLNGLSSSPAACPPSRWRTSTDPVLFTLRWPVRVIQDIQISQYSYTRETE